MIESQGYILVHAKTGEQAQDGNPVLSFRNERYFIRGGVAPHHLNSSGRVYVTKKMTDDPAWAEEYFPSVFGLRWIKYEVKQTKTRTKKNSGPNSLLAG